MKVKHFSIKATLATIFATIATVLLLSSPTNAWGPERATFTNAHPAGYVTFNSITDNVAVGDERNFVRVGEANSTDAYVDTLKIEPGKEYEVYIYYHNNAASNLNPSGKGIANGVKVSSAYPTKVKKGEKGMISGIITATDSNPTSVWDEAYLTTDYDEVVLRYKTGTAIIHNAGKVNGSVLSTNLFTKDGTYIGINKLDGRIPGCAEYSGYITYTLVAEKVSSSLNKQVSTDGTNWSKSVSTSIGKYVTYKVTFKNTGNTTLTNVIFKDTHSNGLTIRDGSIKVYDKNNTSGKPIDNILDISGYNVGNVAPGATVQIIYQARVASNSAYCGKSLKNTITVAYNSTEKQKTSSTTVKTATCDEPKDPCETDPTLPECKDPDPDPCKTDPTLPECKDPDPDPCVVDPALPECNPDPDPCETNPTLPECKDPDPDPCKTDPTLPECNPDPDPCKTNPELPGCKDPSICEEHPDAPGCPTPKTCKTNPELPECQEIPRTGPLEITMAIIVILGIGGAGIYFWRTKYALKTVEDKVSGAKNDPKDPNKKA